MRMSAIHRSHVSVALCTFGLSNSVVLDPNDGIQHTSMEMIVWCVHFCLYIWLEFSIHQTFNVNGSRWYCAHNNNSRLSKRMRHQIEAKTSAKKRVTRREILKLQGQTLSGKINKHFPSDLICNFEWMCTCAWARHSSTKWMCASEQQMCVSVYLFCAMIS